MRDVPNLHHVPESVLAWVDRLHGVVDELAAPLVALHGEGLACRAGCAGCCADDLTVFEIEAALIATRHAELLATEAPHAEGACAFLDAEGRCRAYAARPYVCRTQGLPLRWLDHDEQHEPVEARSVCSLNLDGGAAIDTLPADACWTIGPFEQRLAARQGELDGGEGRRVALRSLFVLPPDAPRRLPLAPPGADE